MNIMYVIVFFFTSFCIEAKIIEKNHINSVVLEIFNSFLPIFTLEEQEFFTTLNPDVYLDNIARTLYT